MRKASVLTGLLVLCSTVSALAIDPPRPQPRPERGLFVMDEGQILSVEKLVKDGEDVQAVYGIEKFCYKGPVDPMPAHLRALKATGNFFSGGGGGHEYKSAEIIRGFARYDLKLTFLDEVAEGETQSVIVKPCPAVAAPAPAPSSKTLKIACGNNAYDALVNNDLGLAEFSMVLEVASDASAVVKSMKDDGVDITGNARQTKVDAATPTSITTYVPAGKYEITGFNCDSLQKSAGTVSYSKKNPPMSIVGYSKVASAECGCIQ